MTGIDQKVITDFKPKGTLKQFHPPNDLILYDSCKTDLMYNSITSIWCRHLANANEALRISSL